MTIAEDDLGTFGSLSRALGITTATGTNSAWFGDPGGGPSNPHGLKHMLSDPDQRSALLDFVDEALGPPAGRRVGDVRWIPLFAHDAPAIVVSAVVETLAGSVRVGIGVDHTTGSTAPFVTSRLHVPLVQMPNGTRDERTSTGSDPAWLLIGHDGGVIGIELDATFTTDAPVPGVAHLGGARVRVGVPTGGTEDVEFALDLVDLQVPGATAPTTQTLDVDNLATVGADVFEFVVGLIRAQAAALDLDDDTFRHIAGLTGVLGLREVDDIPALPLADLPTIGPIALVHWVEEVLGTTAAREAWLVELARLVGGDPDPDRDAVGFTLGDVTIVVGLRVDAGTGGHPILVPWAEVGYATRAGVTIGGGLDVLRLDTGTGALKAIPQIRLEAILGADSAPAAPRLLATGPIQFGSVHVGVRLDDLSTPRFALTLHDVDVSTVGPSHHHDLIDLSTPDAALDAADDLIDTAIADALAGLGAAGDLLLRLLGVDPPAGIDEISLADLVTDPLGAIRGYYEELLATPAAMNEVLATLRALITGEAAIALPGTGDADSPWRMVLLTTAGAELGIAVWRAGGHLVVALAADASTPVLADLAVAAALRMVLLDANLTTGNVDLASHGSASFRLQPADDATAGLDLGLARVEFVSAGVDVSWHAATGLAVRVAGDGLALELFDIQAPGPGGVADLSGPPVRVALPLPTIAADGTLTWTPDWDDIEQILARLLSAAGVPVIDAVLDVLGWSARPGSTVGAHLSLSALIADPAVAIAAWATAIALDCRHLRFAFGVLASVLSGGSITAPFGLGRADLPWRAPVAGEPLAPAVVAWTTPPCPPVPVTSGGAFDLLDGVEGIADPAAVGSVLATALRRASVEVPGLGDLLFAREHLGDGLDQLVTRWTGTDGVIGPTSTMPSDVETVTMPGFSYDELAAAARSDGDVLAGLTAPTTAVVHVGCDPDWGAGHADLIDATGGTSGAAAPSGTVPATGDGAWFVAVPTPVAAAAARTDHDGVAGQAQHLAEVLAARTAPVVVVGTGAAAAAALRVAANNLNIVAVVTVGAPWSPISVTGLQSGPGGDALALLRRLVPTAAEPLPDDLLAQQAWPARRGAGMVRRAIGIAGPSDLPSAGAETRRSDLEVRAVFGLLDASDAALALTATVGEAIRDLSAAAVDETAELATGQPEHLHVGVDVPALSTSIGGITVGAGATIELLHLAPPAAPGGLPVLEAVRELVVRLELGVTDGWLLGGPGATTRDVEVRWIEAVVHVPLADDGSTPESGFTEVILHDAHVFAVDRPRWVIRADGAASIGTDLSAATTALPEAKILLGQVIGRIVATATTLADVFEAIGLIRAGGLDPDGLDRLLYDPGTLLRQRIAADVNTMAAALATIIGSPDDPLRPPSAVDVVVGEARVRFDLATGAVSGHVGLTISPMPPIAIDLSIAPAAVRVDVAVGTIESLVGGVALHVSAAAGTTTPGVRISVDHRAPDGTTPATTMTVPVFPSADIDGLIGLAARLLPATLVQAAATTMRDLATDTGRVALDAALDALALLRAADDAGRRSVIVPFGLISDPVAWVQRRADPLAATMALMEALAPVVVPDRGAQAGWPFDPAFGVTYAVASGRLGVVAGLHLTETVDGAAVVVDVGAGLSVGPTGAPLPVVEATLTIDGWGLRLRSQPRFTLELLRPTPAAPIELYPESPGVGSVIADVGTSLVPVVLNALAAHRNDAGSSLVKDTGAAIYALGDALAIMEGPLGSREFTTGLITTFVSRPAALVDRIPALASAGLGELAHALDPAGAVVATSVLPSGARRFAFGAEGAIHLDIGSSDSTPWIDIGGTFAIEAVVAGVPETLGHVVVEHLRITPAGVQVEARVGPVRIDLGSTVLLPVVVVRAGVSGNSFTRLIGFGVGLDDDGAQSVEFRWTLDGNAPTLVAVTRGTSGEALDHEIAHVAMQLVGVAVSLASGILAEQLATVITDDAAERLDGVVFAGGGRQIDPTLVTDLLTPERLLTRLQTFAWNCATGPSPLSITIDSTVTLALVAHTVGPDQHLGVSVNLAPGKTFPLARGDVNVTLEVDASWVDPVVPAGLSIFVLKGNAPDALSVDFGLAVAGIGVRFSKTAGPLVELGAIALDGIAVHLYGEATSSGLGGGVRLQLSGLAVAPGGGGSGNGMANSLVNDAGAAGANNRPSFSPSLSVQKHPGVGQGVKVGLRAGDPPGPWFVVIQRQLGPIYVERIGLNTVEQNGKVTRISLLFSGSVSLFGLSAAVDQLSLNWNGGDVLAITSWSADLMGLAVSADMAGVSLAGGLLKSVDPNGVVSYVGMLVGRFATYGLSVFGGYASDPAGHASFFVFGAVTGPIGGPPAFFVTGIGGGLGINRGLIVPTDISDFATYPFIQALDPAASAPSNPMAELQRLNTYFPHSPGNFWFAAGISFNSFALVDGIAVVAVAFGDGLEINLLGLARMALPRPGAALVSIELALLARFSTREGVFMIKAQLTDNSWVLYEDIRLTGGFAFALWWKGPLAGQFVVTMGGYHPDFHRDGYPDVPRLGLVWQISSAIVMKGESYFALTSEALMAGTRVEVSVDFGWVWARIEFGADGIVYFDPFFFDVRAYCRISAGIDIDLGLFSISLSLTLGASIHVWGPDFAGEVRFEIGPCEVPISFGPQAQRPGPTLDWPAFVTKYLEDAGSSRARALSGITGRGTLPTSTGGGQGAPSADGSAALPFRVFAEFEVSFTTTIPAITITVGGATKTLPPVLSNGAPVAMGLAPMGAGTLTSQLSVALRQRIGSSWQPEPRLAKLAANLTAGAPLADGSRTTTDAFPTGVWGPPKALASGDNQPLPSGDVVITGNRVILVAGIDAVTVGPQIDYYQVTSGVRPLPLSATGNDRSQFLQAAGNLTAVTATSAAQALQLAGDTLFSPVAAGAGEALNTFGKASYAYDRVAPPRFGNLTDGLARLNGDDGARTALPQPAAKAVPVARAPFIAAHLASGPGAATKAPGTSVADGRIKRRPAPTIESVRGRMGLHIPATLTTVAPTAVVRDDTVIAALSVPRTDVLGAVHSTAAGPIGRVAFGNLVGGITSGKQAPRASGRRSRDESAPSSLPTGDLVVLQSPDAHIDVATPRPSIAVGGRARVVMLTAHGVVHDDDAIDTAVVVPPETTLIAVQADGDADALDGLSGWHDRSRIGLVGPRAAVAAGCTIVVDGQGADAGIGWATAGVLTTGADEIHTRFSRPMRTVAVALTGAVGTDVERTRIDIVGGRLATDRDGTPRRPAVVTLATTSVLVYDVVPDRGAEALTVAATPGSDWTVTGVLGAGGPNEARVPATELAERLARRGIEALTAQLTVMQGPGCTVTWQAAEPPRSAPAPRRRTKQPAAKKVAATKKAAPRKVAGTKKTPAKTAATKKTTAKKVATKKAATKKAAATRTTPARRTSGRRTT